MPLCKQWNQYAYVTYVLIDLQWRHLVADGLATDDLTSLGHTKLL